MKGTGTEMANTNLVIVPKKGANLPVGECILVKEGSDSYVVKAAAKSGRGRGVKIVLRQYIIPKSEVAYLYVEKEVSEEEASQYPLTGSNGVRVETKTPAAAPAAKAAAPADGDKPKRKRRTKAEMEADKAAAPAKAPRAPKAAPVEGEKPKRKRRTKAEMEADKAAAAAGGEGTKRKRRTKAEMEAAKAAPDSTPAAAPSAPAEAPAAQKGLSLFGDF